jgi:N-acetylglucosamine kinase-like BadF-type ATPase
VNASAYFLGVDGGGTKTEALVADAQGNILGRGLGGPANANFTGYEIAVNSLETAVTQAINHAGSPSITQTAICAPTIGHYCSIKTLAEKLRLPVESLQLYGDDLSTFYGALGKETGIVVLAGTGSFALGIDHTGKKVSLGGWGSLAGDEGSGYAIGLSAIKAAITEYDRRGPSTQLTPLIISHFNITDIGELRTRLYQQSNYQQAISTIAPLVLQSACSGDYIAIQIIEQAACDLAQLGIDALNQLNLDLHSDWIALTGGIARFGDLLWEPFCASIHAVVPELQVRPARFAPGVGALMCVYKSNDIPFSPALLNHLETSYAAILHSPPEV